MIFSLCDKKIEDDLFPGFSYLIDQLSQLKDHQLVWKFVDWAMEKDQRKSVEIFTFRSNDELVSERMRIDTIIENIQKYKEALIIYLEFIVFTKNNKVGHLKIIKFNRLKI